MSKDQELSPELSPEEQRFLAEETTDTQVKDQASVVARIEAEKAKAEGWAESQERERAAWDQGAREVPSRTGTGGGGTGRGTVPGLRSVGTGRHRPDDTQVGSGA